MRRPCRARASGDHAQPAASHANALNSRIRLPHDALLAAVGRAPRQPLRDALQATLAHLQSCARSGRGLLSDVLGSEAAFAEWRHYPENDAVDPRSGYRFYYHAHAAAQRARDEHGHFHVFAPRPRRAAGQAAHAHLFAVSVNAQGMPTRVFTTNRWVTAEHWESAPWILRALRGLDLSGARPRRVADWVQNMARLFAPQIQEVIRQRDLRIAERARHNALDRVLEDRRTHIITQCQVDLARQFRFLQDAGLA